MPDKIKTLYNAGVKAQASGELKKALEYYRMALEIDSSHFESWLNAGSIYSKIGKSKKAIICYQRAIVARPDKRAFYNLAFEYFKNEQYQEALRILQKLVLSHFNFLEAHLLMAYTWGKLGDNQKALQSVEKALQLDRHHLGALTAKVLVLFHTHQLKECEALLDKLLQKNKDDLVLQRLKAALFIEKDNALESAKILKTLAKHDPKLKTFQTELKNAQAQKPELKQTIEKKLAQTLQKPQKTNQDLFNLSLLSFFKGDAEAAMDYLVQLIPKPTE